MNRLRMPVPFSCLGFCSVVLAMLSGCAAAESEDTFSGGNGGTTSDAANDSPASDTAQPDVAPDVEEEAAPDVQVDTSGEAAESGVDAQPDGDCPANTKPCGGDCVDIDDPDYGCGDATCDPCALDNALAVCDGAECVVDDCEAGYANCDNLSSNGCETDLLSDPDNCGICDNDCLVPNGTAGCDNGSCTIAACNAGFDSCDPSILNGCEANLQLDPSHCGECDHLCQPVGSSACANGVCQTTGCDPGEGDCDGLPDNGCEEDLNTSVNHCGFCGNACNLSHATAQCTGGQCAIVACDLGFANCDGVAANGCEVDTTSTVSHCGACNAPCSNLNNTSRACTNSACAYVCNGGFADCNGPQGGLSDDGCETVTSADVNNCGGCGVVCSAVNGSNQCVTGACSPQCSAGYGNCDGNPNNGCETSTSGNASHCGTCGTVCQQVNGANACVAGTCHPTCVNGFSDCDGNPNNGCERATGSDPNNCGGCGIQCLAQNGTTSCLAGVCVPSCSSGFGNCDGNPNNGCETDTSNNPSNCGTCGHSCAVAHTQTSCLSGGCVVVSCDAYYFDNNGFASDGCEYQCQFATPSAEQCDGADNDCDGAPDEDFDFQNDPNHCGNCTTTCGSATGGLCCSGSCRPSNASNCGACDRVCTSGMLVINEVLANPGVVGDTAGEWFEVYNPNAYDIDLRGFTLQDDDLDSHVITSALPVIVPAGGYVVLGSNASFATNGGVGVDYQYGQLSLANGDDELEIVAHGSPAVVLDRITWTTAFATNGISKELSRNHQNATSNNSASNWCSAVSTFGSGDRGTPGGVNDCSL